LLGKPASGREKLKKKEGEEKKKVTTSDAHLQCMIEVRIILIIIVLAQS